MKVLVVDDNPIVRIGLRAVLERVESVTEVVEAADGFEALERATAHKPEIVLLDVHMPGRSGLEVLPELVKASAVVMLTSDREPQTMKQALELGAKGYLVHGQLGLHEVAGAIELCRKGGLALGPEASDVFLGHAGPADEPHPFERMLIAREAEILKCAAEGGASNKEIADRLFLSERTVKNYLNSAYPKIGVHSRSEAVSAWLRAAP